MQRPAKAGIVAVLAVVLLGLAVVAVRLALSGFPGGVRPPRAGSTPSATASEGAQATPPQATPPRTTAPRLPNGALPLIRPGAPPPASGEKGPPGITVSAETELFPEATGDVADDSAIWRNPDRPGGSFVLADDKSRRGGVAVYDLSGSLVYYERTGKIGNIDLRDGVRLGDRSVVLVGANDRSNDTLRFWVLDPASGGLTSVEARALATLAPNYGFCLGRDSTGTRTYAFVSAEGGGGFEQYELRLTSGRVDAARVRPFDVGSQAEGCVVDDATGSLYVGEEDVGIWRYDVDPATGPRRTEIDRVGRGRLTADVEGLSAARGPDGRGVLMASSQGDSTFAVYDLDGTHEFRGSFQVRRGGSVDGASETDGLAVAAGDFGPGFPNGLLVVHDGENRKADGADERCSNLKFARLDQVIALTPTG